MKRTKISNLLQTEAKRQEINVKGWVRTKRGSKHVSFIALNDGSTINNIQIVAEGELFEEETLKLITTGACLSVDGELVASQGSGQKVEITAKKIIVLGVADPEEYPLQPKKHSLEREKKHICVFERIPSVPYLEYGMPWLLPFIIFSMIGALCTCIHPLLQVLMPKVQVKCFG